MSQRYIVPSIYQDISDQSQGYFAFRFTCQECYWSVDTRPIRSSVSTATNIMDIGVGLLGGFWGRAAQAGEQIYGSKWHAEQADALQKAWGDVQHEFHLCPKCHRTVCMRCFNTQLNLCTGADCAPDLRADRYAYASLTARSGAATSASSLVPAACATTSAVATSIDTGSDRRFQYARLSSSGYVSYLSSYGSSGKILPGLWF